MFKAIKEFFVGKPKEEPVVESAPYKVPEPAATTPIPLVVTNSNPADNAPVVEVTAPVAVEVAPAPKAAPAKKAPAKKQQYAKKNSAPRKPRAPKAPK
jgi:hypothetical protein